MRKFLAVAVLVGAGGLAVGQPAAETPPRFDIRYRDKSYPQTTPKQTLESVIEAVEKADYGYLVAHLMDPAFVDARVADRAKQYEPAVEDSLAKTRAAQRERGDAVPAAARIPDDPVQFRALAAERARRLSFEQLVRDVQDKLGDHPQAFKELQRVARVGTFSDAETTSKAELADVKDRAVFFRKVGDRWYIENRQTDEQPKK